MSKIKLPDFVKYGQLFEIYQNLLSEDRQKIMANYFQFNMTLAEIASERNVSRQAVLDAIKKSCKKLDDVEKKLCLKTKREQFFKVLQELAKLGNKKVKQKVEEIIRKI